MKHRNFISKIRDTEIVAAIRAAEEKTSGEIRVFVSHKTIEDPVAAAQREFEKLGMTQTHERNGVLIYVAPRSQKFAIIGDSGVHQHCGDAFWREVADEMVVHFRKGDFQPGIIHGIQKAGALLAKHFPCKPDSGNELPDRVGHD